MTTNISLVDITNELTVKSISIRKRFRHHHLIRWAHHESLKCIQRISNGEARMFLIHSTKNDCIKGVIPSSHFSRCLTSFYWKSKIQLKSIFRLCTQQSNRLKIDVSNEYPRHVATCCDNSRRLVIWKIAMHKSLKCIQRKSNG